MSKCVCERANCTQYTHAHVFGIKFFELISMMMLEWIPSKCIHLLSTNWLTLKSCLTDRLSLIHFTYPPALPWCWCVESIWNLRWLLGRAHEYSLQCLNAWTLFFICFSVFFWFCFVLFPSRSIHLPMVVKIDLIRWWFAYFQLQMSLAFLNCQYSEDLNPFS